jgi:transposase
MVFSAVYKVYVGFSFRRFTSDLRDACVEGHVNSTPPFNSVNRYLANPALTAILKEFVTVRSLPLKAVEADFAVDATGFPTSRFVRWYNAKYGRKAHSRNWFKCHLVCGVKTKVITALDISGCTVHDSCFFDPLVSRTAKHFEVSEIAADKAYLGRRNMETVEALGGTPYISFKTNTVEPKGESIWAKMYHLFMYNREAFMFHYHKRSNAESAFSMMKRKLGDAVRSKSEVGQVNEVLAKCLYHNVCVPIRATHELGVQPTFGAESGVEPKLFI